MKIRVVDFFGHSKITELEQWAHDHGCEVERSGGVGLQTGASCGYPAAYVAAQLQSAGAEWLSADLSDTIRQESRLVREGNTELSAQDVAVENQQDACFLSETQLDVLLRNHGTGALKCKSSNELNWCTSLAYDYFFKSFSSRALTGKRTARRISIVNTGDADTTGFHWCIVVCSIGCNHVHTDVNAPVNLTYDESDDQCEWDLLCQHKDRPKNDGLYSKNEKRG